MRRILLLTTLLAAPAAAQAPMSGPEFGAYAEGKILTFSADGIPYGIEEYRPNRQVRWAFIGGECKLGEWYPVGDQICFDYFDETGQQCWRFYDEGPGLRAEFVGGTGTADLYETQESDEMPTCMGPDVGV